MNHTVIPAGYEPALSLYETQAAISLIKRTFQDHLAQALNLKRVSAPLFVDPASGLNDDLNGVERPVSFDIPAAGRSGQRSSSSCEVMKVTSSESWVRRRG